MGESQEKLKHFVASLQGLTEALLRDLKDSLQQEETRRRYGREQDGLTARMGGGELGHVFFR